MTDLSRRGFLARSAALGAALPLAGLAGLPSELRAAPAARQPVCVFSKPLQWLDYEALAETVREAGFDGLDLSVRPGGHVLPEKVADDLPRAVEAARRVGLVVPMMVTAITDARAPHAESVLRTAAGLGITHYRMGYYDYRDELGMAGSLEAHRPKLRELAQLNQSVGIRGGYQNHAGTRVGGAVWDLWELLKGLDPRWIGVQYDICHAVTEGTSSWPVAMKLLGPSIHTLAVKDLHFEKGPNGRWRAKDVPLGEGMVDWDAYLKLVRQIGVPGPITVHYEYPPLEGGTPDPVPAQRRRQAIAAMRKDLLFLRQRLEAAGLAGTA